MNWEALGAIGEIVGAVVVVATLGYLAIQIRQNTHTVRVAAEASQQELGSDFRGHIIDNAEVASIYLRGLQDYDSLAEGDQVRFRMLMFTAFMSYQYRFVHQSHNLMDPELAERGDNILRYYLALPGIRQWWGTAQARFTPGFAKHVAALMQERTAVCL